MNSLTSSVMPTATDMIRMDHTHVLSTFHKFRAETSTQRKQAIVNSVCLALEIHAQIEEEIFYPALREVVNDMPALDKSVPEHVEVRRMIGVLRTLDPTDLAYEPNFMDLMRNVMHHVADEETILLPVAERALADRLGELGAQMTRRRLQLSAPKAGAIAWNTAIAMPQSGMLMAAGAVAIGAYLVGRGSRNSGEHASGRHGWRHRAGSRRA